MRTHDKLSLPTPGSRWGDKDKHNSSKQSQVYDLLQDCTTLSMDENCKELGSYHCTSTTEKFFLNPQRPSQSVNEKTLLLPAMKGG